MTRLLEVHGLKKHFPIYKGVFSHVAGYVYAVDGVSLHIDAARRWGSSGRAAAASRQSAAPC
jgi:ABC-type oligopeptide transport system ATPase subunit